MKRVLATTVASVLLIGAASVWSLYAQDKSGSAPEPDDAQTEQEREDALWTEAGRCGDCHAEESWHELKAPEEAAFEHASTGFPLDGEHRQVACNDCHRRGLSALTQACGSCHHDPHSGRNTLACQQCHTARSWKVPRNFFRHERTRFPLTGVHASLQCESCHRPARGEMLGNTPSSCRVCHLRDQRRGTPNHVAAGFTECGYCHTTTTFRGARYTHRAYVLDGVHASQRCTTCHTGSVFAGLAQGGNDCLACHQTEFNSTANRPGIPDHTVGAPFGSDCGRCHFNVAPPFSFVGAQIR